MVGENLAMEEFPQEIEERVRLKKLYAIVLVLSRGGQTLLA